MLDNKRLLIVDDEEQARLYLACIVKELHPEVELLMAASPNEALFILQNENVDCVLLDVEMPGMSGLEMLEKVRLYTEDKPVIFVSGYKRAEFIQSAMRLNALDYIDKPVNPKELNNALLKAFKIQGQKATIGKSSCCKERFYLMTSVGEMFVNVNELIYFETLKRYSTAYFADGTQKVIRHNLEALMNMLPNNTFLRVSRQNIINIRSIKYISKSNKTITLQCSSGVVVLNRIYPNILNQLLEMHKI
jgi:two-component system, LytTR family, response regulator